MLINLIYYYAYCFDYQESIDENGEVCLKLNIIDPLNESNNVGGKKT